MFNILKLNEISPVANKVFDKNYNVSNDVEKPEGIMLRSFNMQEYPLNKELLAVARAGAGVNNIPLDKCAEKGIVVFNTPGANANAVKELVIATLFLSSRKIVDSIEWVKTLKGEADLSKLVEKGKGKFVGREIYGKKLGVIGLGAIGAMVANTAIDLGMDVYGYDPYISVDSAWTLSRGIKRIIDLTDLLTECDYITIHVPYTSANKDMFNDEVFSKMKQDSVLINLSRGELVNNQDVIKYLNNGKLSRYVTDFPADELIGVPNSICISHLGASTPEAEDNCAFMAGKELVDYLENGNIANSVNYPTSQMSRSGVCRIAIHHLNIKEMLKQITHVVSENSLNIENMQDSSKKDYAYCMMDLDNEPSTSLIEKLKAIEGVIRVRIIH